MIYRRPHDPVHIIGVFLWKTARNDGWIRVTTRAIERRTVRGLRASCEVGPPDLLCQTRPAQVPVNEGTGPGPKVTGTHTSLRLLHSPCNMSPEKAESPGLDWATPGRTHGIVPSTSVHFTVYQFDLNLYFKKRADRR